jgi:hypothetical protein
MTKTVFVLGAGASVLAKLPPQQQILKRIFSEANDFLSISGNELLQKTATRYFKAKQNIAEFIVRMFSDQTFIDFIKDEAKREEILKKSDEDILREIETLKNTPEFMNRIFTFIREEKSYITLEDIFTILDKAILSNEHIQGYNLSHIIQLREDFIMCIMRMFVEASNHFTNDNNTYKMFVNKLIDQRIQAGLEGDPFSIITLNWDFVIENYFYHEIQRRNDEVKLRIDYCVYDHNFHHYFTDSSEDNTPSTVLKRQGVYNIKFLKLHGAMNWLICKNCHRMFYSFSEYIAIREFFEDDPPECPFCKENYHLIGNNNQVKLKSELITPTLLKDLSNVTFRNIWKNAFVELSEADKVVFIGYSLPQADFELRYMIKKAIKPNTQIDVVLYHNDDPSELEHILEENQKGIISLLPTERYRSFFGLKQMNFYYDGIEEYVERRM